MWHQLDLLLDKKTQDAEREFYGLIGLVAVRFARLEASLTNLLGTLIHPDDDLLTATLTDDIRLGLARQIELIKKIGRMRAIDDKELKELISTANSLRQDRNDYIHGIWDIEIKEDKHVVARCKQRKISFKQEGTRKHWERFYKSKKVTIDTLRRTAIKLEDLLKKVNKLNQSLEEEPHDYF